MKIYSLFIQWLFTANLGLGGKVSFPLEEWKIFIFQLNCNFFQTPNLTIYFEFLTGEKPYKCITCEKEFVSSGVLKAHMKTHMGTKDFRCEICNAAFTTNGSLTRHMNVHITYTKRPFKCSECDQSFRTASQCKRHEKQHRPGNHIQ